MSGEAQLSKEFFLSFWADYASFIAKDREGRADDSDRQNAELCCEFLDFDHPGRDALLGMAGTTVNQIGEIMQRMHDLPTWQLEDIACKRPRYLQELSAKIRSERFRQHDLEWMAAHRW